MLNIHAGSIVEVVTGETSAVTGEMHSILARISGEMAPEDIPPAPGVDVDAIKDGDEDPLEVVVEIPPGRSTRGWNYLDQSLLDIVNHVNSETLPGYLGHQKQEDVSTEFPDPVTHWIGAVWKNGKAYFRGIIDKSAPNLKRWIRSKRIRQVSFYGLTKLRKSGGETQVIGYEPYSIDWTPLNRSGLPTRVVATGEMDSTFASITGEFDGSYEAIVESIAQQVSKGLGANTYAWVQRLFMDNAIVSVENKGVATLYRYPYTVEDDMVALGEPEEVKEIRSYVTVDGETATFSGEMDGSHESLRQTLYEAARTKFGGEGIYVGVDRVYDSTVIVTYEKSGTRRLYAVPYSVQGDGVVLGQPREVELEVRREYVPVGEMKEDDEDMKLAEMLAAIRSAMAKGETDLVQVLGEIGYTKDQVVEQLAGEQMQALQAAKDVGAKVFAALGLSTDTRVEDAVARAGEMAAVWNALGFDEDKPENAAQVAGEMAEAVASAASKEHEGLIDRVIGEKVTGEQAQALVRKMLRVPTDATEEQIAGEIDSVLNDEAVKGALSKLFTDKPPKGSGSSKQGDQRQYTRTKSVRV